MTRSPADFVAALPSGEWENVEIIGQADGMMAGHNWAILARATSLRYGGKPAFLKCILVAGPTAGPNTNFVTAKDRVERVRVRVEACRAIAPPVPLVPILECRFLVGFEGLLIAMERVTPLHSLLDEGKTDSATALNILRILDPGTTPRWHHYDVCPKNVAVTAEGTPVFIDVESFYLPDKGTFDVSVPATKDFRMPGGLAQQVQDELAANENRLTAASASRKQAFDLVLLAAQCSLGWLPDFERRDGLYEPWLDRLATEAPAEKRELAAFWAEQLRPAIVDGATLNVHQIADEFAQFIAGKRGATPAAVAPTPVSLPVSAPTPTATAPQEARALTEFEHEWERLRGTARDLRRDSLDATQIAQYRVRLEALAHKYPSNPLVWDELLLVVISYQRNAADALRLVEQATKARPTDANLKRWHQIVAMWATT